MIKAKDLLESDFQAEKTDLAHRTELPRRLTAREIMEDLFEDSTTVAPPPTKPKEPLTKPVRKPKYDPWRRREIKPGESPRPKACESTEAVDEAKKKKAKGQVAPSPGKVTYGKKTVKEMLEEVRKKSKGQIAPSPGKVGYPKKKVKESLARRLLDA